MSRITDKFMLTWYHEAKYTVRRHSVRRGLAGWGSHDKFFLQIHAVEEKTLRDTQTGWLYVR